MRLHSGGFNALKETGEKKTGKRGCGFGAKEGQGIGGERHPSARRRRVLAAVNQATGIGEKTTT